MPLLTTCHSHGRILCADQGQLVKAQHAQQTAQGPLHDQPKILHAFNPDAPVFISSKVPQAAKPHSDQSSVSFPPPSLGTKTAAEAAELRLDKGSTVTQPASPRIAAKGSAPSNQAGSPQQTQTQTQTATEQPSANEPLAAGAATSCSSESPNVNGDTAASQSSRSSLTHAETAYGIDDPRTSPMAAQDAWLTAGQLL